MATTEQRRTSERQRKRRYRENQKKIALLPEPRKIATNGHGGEQSALPYRCDLIPPLATLAVCHVLHGGAAKYGEDNWYAIPARDHINHVITHYLAWLSGDRSEDHLANAGCRALFALEQVRAGRLCEEGDQ